MVKQFKDSGKQPFVANLVEMAKLNENYREAIWTGEEFQITLMSIPTGGGDIGMEIHRDHDQMLYLAAGTGKVQMGDAKDQISFEKTVTAGQTVIVPKNVWHNITNIGSEEMKVFSLYAPVKHPADVVQENKPE